MDGAQLMHVRSRSGILGTPAGLGPSKDGTGTRFMLPPADQDQPVGSAVPLSLFVG